jgi:hypothetical protein
MEKAQEEKQDKVAVVEREITLSLINDKLNYVIAKLEKQ